jgi:hypothetical protein
MATPQTAADSEGQVRTDYEIGMRTFMLDNVKDPNTYRVFCLGVTMCTMTLQGFAENKDNWPRDAADVEEAVEGYFEAARRALHAD